MLYLTILIHKSFVFIFIFLLECSYTKLVNILLFRCKIQYTKLWLQRLPPFHWKVCRFYAKPNLRLVMNRKEVTFNILEKNWFRRGSYYIGRIMDIKTLFELYMFCTLCSKWRLAFCGMFYCSTNCKFCCTLLNVFNLGFYS